jgi:hypothetical protein
VAFVDASQEHVPFKSRMDKAIAKIKKSKIWDDPKKSGNWKSSWLNWKR